MSLLNTLNHFFSLNRFRLVIPMLLFGACAYGQDDKKEVRSGNVNYEHGNYSEAELNYRKALEKNATSYPGSYNLGSSLYRQDKNEEAAASYAAAADKAKSNEEKAKAYHNLGNALVKSGKFEEGITAYKNALRLNPEDNDTRYNLAYAQSMLRKQQQQQQQQNKDQNENKDQKDNQQQKENQNKSQDQKKKENADNKDQQQQDKSKDGQEKQQPRPKISKEDAERILQALKNNEQELNKKLSKKEGVPVIVEKNW